MFKFKVFEFNFEAVRFKCWFGLFLNNILIKI